MEYLIYITIALACLGWLISTRSTGGRRHGDRCRCRRK